MLPILAAALVLALAPAPGRAEADGPDFYRVSDVSPGGSLHIRSGPGRDYGVIGRIPSDGDGIRNLGCRGGMTLEQFEAATEAERMAAKRSRWCRIEYAGVTGWAAGWHLAEGSAPAAETSIAGVTWRLVGIAGGAVAGEPWIRFEPDGSVSGNSGCNSFGGTARIAAATIAFGPLASTRMACAEQGLMTQESRLFGILEDELTYRAAADLLELTRPADGATLSFERRQD